MVDCHSLSRCPSKPFVLCHKMHGYANTTWSHSTSGRPASLSVDVDAQAPSAAAVVGSSGSSSTTTTASPSPENHAGRMLAFQVAENALLGDDDDDDERDVPQDTFLWERPRHYGGGRGSRAVARSRSTTPPLTSFAADWLSSCSLVTSSRPPPILTSATNMPDVVSLSSSPSSSPPRTPRRKEAIKTSRLSPRASPFAPAAQPSSASSASSSMTTFALPWESRTPAAAASASVVVQRPSAPSRRPTHNRSHSGHTYSFITTTPPTPDPGRVDERHHQTTSSSSSQAPGSWLSLDAADEASPDAFLSAPPPPRSLTPQPFKRPSFAEEMHEQRTAAAAGAISPSSLLNCGRRPGLPSLAEIRAAVESRDAISDVHRRRLMSTSQKRMSVESTSSCSSNESFARCTGDDAASESSAASSSEPTTPVRASRLPLFLLQGSRRRRGSTDSDTASSSRPVEIRDPNGASEDRDDALACPLLRVIPPTLDTKQSQATPSLPIITWTPATAPVIKISPFAELERQADARRAERARAMISTLGKRTLTHM